MNIEVAGTHPSISIDKQPVFLPMFKAEPEHIHISYVLIPLNWDTDIV